VALKILPFLLLTAVGCASPYAFRRADCVRYPKFQGYRVLVCNDDAVNNYCQKRIIKANGKRDDGLLFRDNPYFVRGCAVFRRVGKPSVVVGKMSTGCIPHEVGHIEYPLNPAYVAEKFPCAEDVGR